MGSGSFPLESSDPDGARLLDAADIVQSVCDALRDDVYSGDSGGNQFDNAASDGGALARLTLAERLIRAEVRIVRGER